MGAIFTSRRKTPKRPQVALRQTPPFTGPWVDRNAGTTPLLNGTMSMIDTQVTTSYRSRGRQGDIEVQPSNAKEFIILEQEKGNFKPPGYDIGHEFSTSKITRDYGFNDGGFIDIYYDGSSTGSPNSISRLSHPVPGNYYKHNGVNRPVLADPAPEWFITTDDVSMGKALINSAAPNRPSANVSVTLGELLFGGLPALSELWKLRDRTSAIKALGSEYLNVNFGWFPLVADITKIVQALQNATAILDNFQRNSGQFVRRRRSLPPLEVTYLYEGSNVIEGSANSLEAYRPDGSLLTAPSGGFAASTSGTVVSISARQDRWFSGAFTYYVPEPGHGFFGDLARFEALANKLLGTRLTPEVLWEIAPWSWLVDWFVGVQNNISVATRFQSDGLVLHYGYLMVRDRVTVNSLHRIRYASKANASAPIDYNASKNAFARTTLDRKRRIKSTPFGFGLNPSSFTARQWSILAALGMTRGPRTLR
jgi:hypothetical protein